MSSHLPVAKPRPNAKEFIDILMGRVKSKRTPLVEYLVDGKLMKEITEGLLGECWVDETLEPATRKAHFDRFIDFFYRLGYDIVRIERGLPFPIKSLASDDDTMAQKRRYWVDEHHGTIASWEDFEKYPWPKVEEFDFFAYDYINSHLPDGMGLVCCHAGGMYEHLSQMMSYEGLSYALMEEPELVAAVTQRIGERMEVFYRHLVDLDRLVAIFPGDDMGFKTATLVSPDTLRQYTLPWHKRFAALAHRRGVPYFLHSCGLLTAIMDDLIRGVGIDGKHSYEDAIIPVEEFQTRYGDRIAVLGGFDVHLLSTLTEDGVRKKARQLIETCGGRGRYAIGSGNSIPSYIPTANYLAMVDQAVAMM